MMQPSRFFCLSALLALCAGPIHPAVASVQTATLKDDGILTENAVADASATAPSDPSLLFVPNQGQWEAGVQYKALMPGGQAIFNQETAVLGFTRQSRQALVRMTALGANPKVRLEAGEQLVTQLNLFRGHGLSESYSGIPTYAKLAYRDLYPGVDLLFQERDGRLAYDLLLAPGVAPETLRFALEGVEKLTLEPDGSMLMRLQDGTQVRQEAPLIYQELQGERVVIDGNFRIFPEASDANRQVYGFQLAAFDSSQPLVIDPTFHYGTSPTLRAPPQLRYSRLVGGDDDESVEQILTDFAGNMMVVGTTESDIFPAAGGASILNPDNPSGATPIAAPADGFIYKIDANGNLLFITVLAGDDDDSIRDVAIDGAGNIFVTGATGSANFATMPDALYPVLSGKQNAFLTKLNSAGSQILFSTYYGGTNSDAGNAIAIDATGNVFIAGETSSDDLIVRGALQPQRAGGTDGFIARFDNDGKALKYATYFGGTGTDRIQHLLVSPWGDLFFGGNTTSSNLPIKHEIQDRGGSQDIFLARIARGGGELVFSTYLGGNRVDELTGMVRDERGNYLLSGWTQSTNFPTRNPWQPKNAGGTDGVLVKVDKSGRFLHFSTYIGGLEDDSAQDVAVDQVPDSDGVSNLKLHYIYTGGQTESHFIPVQNPYQNYHAGAGDGYLMKFEPCGQQLWFSSYFGGRAEDSITQLATAPAPKTATEQLQAQANKITGIQEIFFAGQTESEEGEISSLFPIKPAGQTQAGGFDTFGAFINQIDNLRTSNEPELVIGCNPEPFAPERVCSNCGRNQQLTLRLLDPNNVGVSAFSTTIYFDPDELQFQQILWNPDLPGSTNLQYDNTVPGQLKLDLYQPIGGINFAPLVGLIATLEFATVQVGTVRDNPPLPSKMIRLTQGQLSSSNRQGQDTPITGLAGAMLVERRCNNLIGDCDCSGQVQLFEIQSGVGYYTQRLPEDQPFCLKRDYSVMRTTDLQEIINNYNERNIEQDLLDAANSKSLPTGSILTPNAIVAATSALEFEDVVFNGIDGTLAYDLTLDTKGQSIAVLATDIYYDPTQVTGIQVMPREGTQNANKQLAYAVVRPGWLRVTFYGINATTFPSDPVAHLRMTLAPTVTCSNLVNLYQKPSASTPFAEAVPIESNSILACEPIDDQPDRSSLSWQVSELYISIFEYAPDQEGLEFWVRQILNDARWTIPTLARSFYNQPDAQALYAKLDNTQFVTTVYQFLFGRKPDTFELLYWKTLLDAGLLARADAIPTIINVAYANPAMAEDMQQVTNMVEVGLAFARRQKELSIVYSQLSNNRKNELRNKGREVLKGVTSDPFTRDVAISRIPSLLPSEVLEPPTGK